MTSSMDFSVIPYKNKRIMLIQYSLTTGIRMLSMEALCNCIILIILFFALYLTSSWNYQGIVYYVKIKRDVDIGIIYQIRLKIIITILEYATNEIFAYLQGFFLITMKIF